MWPAKLEKVWNSRFLHKVLFPNKYLHKSSEYMLMICPRCNWRAVLKRFHCSSPAMIDMSDFVVHQIQRNFHQQLDKPLVDGISSLPSCASLFITSGVALLKILKAFFSSFALVKDWNPGRPATFSGTRLSYIGFGNTFLWQLPIS